jgi:Gly-Xaa carboxypeptidase
MVLNRIFSQPTALHPSRRLDITQRNVDSLFRSKHFRDEVAQRLADAVRIPTITYDGMGHVGQDARWDVFYQFSAFLKHAFPRM